MTLVRTEFFAEPTKTPTGIVGDPFSLFWFLSHKRNYTLVQGQHIASIDFTASPKTCKITLPKKANCRRKLTIWKYPSSRAPLASECEWGTPPPHSNFLPGEALSPRTPVCYTFKLLLLHWSITWSIELYLHVLNVVLQVLLHVHHVDTSSRSSSITLKNF